MPDVNIIFFSYLFSVLSYQTFFNTIFLYLFWLFYFYISRKVHG